MKTKFNILIIDDAFFIRNLIKKSILKKPEKTTINGEPLKFEVISECSDGQEGLILCKKLKPDIITLDLNMPNLNGMDVIKTLQKEQPDIHIIVITSNKNKEMAEKILNLNCRFIQKPYQDHLLYQDLDEIAQLVNENKNPVQEGKEAIKTPSKKTEKPTKPAQPKVKQEVKLQEKNTTSKKKETSKKVEDNSLASKISSAGNVSIKNKQESFSYFTETDKKAGNKKGNKIEEFIEEPIIEIEPNAPIEDIPEQTIEDFEDIPEDNVEELIIDFTSETKDNNETADELDDFDDFDDFGDFEIDFNAEPETSVTKPEIEEDTELETEVEIVEDYTKEEDKHPLELSLEKEETFEEMEDFDDKEDDLVFFVENEKVEDTISEDMKKHLESNKDVDFNDMDENNDEYIRFSKNDVGENNEYMDLLMSMSYSYNMEIGYKLDQLEAKKDLEKSRQQQLNTKLEELKDPNLHSILRNQQEQTKLIEEIESVELEKDEFDDFDDFEFNEDPDEEDSFDVGSNENSNIYNQNGYTIAPPVKNKYEVKKPLKDTEPIFIPKEQTQTPETKKKKKGLFSKIFHKKNKK